MSRAVLAMGSNVGDRFFHLNAVVRDLGTRVVGVSSVYENPPWGPVPQEDYLNAVVVATDDDYEANDWLSFAARMEQSAGRTRDLRWGPRTLDVDVITVLDRGRQVVSDDPWFTIPHPRARERAFVLVPWSQVAPDDELPGAGRVADLAEALPSGERAALRRRDDLRWVL